MKEGIAMAGKHLIVGATGGIGRATAKALVEMGKEVVCFSRNKEKAEKYYADLKGVKLVQGDASKSENIEKNLDGVDSLYYCVNIPYPEWEEKARKLMAVSMEAAIKHNVKFVFPGNVYVFGIPQFNPITEGHPKTAMTKKGIIRIEMEEAIERAARLRGLKYTIVRLPDFYGPYVINGFYDLIFLNALRGKKMKWFGDLKVPTEFVFIEDAGKAMAISGTNEKADNMMFHIPGYKETTAGEFLKEIKKQSPKNPSISALNIQFLVQLAGTRNKMVKEFAEVMYLKQKRVVMNGEFFRTMFCKLPATPYEEGIKKTLEWTKSWFKV